MCVDFRKKILSRETKLTPWMVDIQVDEGIETMLCCWLQQLQEFGGPEVEKPDLLQLGSVSSLKPCLRTSTGNLTRHNFFKDPRARYNVSTRVYEIRCVIRSV